MIFSGSCLYLFYTFFVYSKIIVHRIIQIQYFILIKIIYCFFQYVLHFFCIQGRFKCQTQRAIIAVQQKCPYQKVLWHFLSSNIYRDSLCVRCDLRNAGCCHLHSIFRINPYDQCRFSVRFQ